MKCKFLTLVIILIVVPELSQSISQLKFNEFNEENYFHEKLFGDYDDGFDSIYNATRPILNYKDMYKLRFNPEKLKRKDYENPEKYDEYSSSKEVTTYQEKEPPRFIYKQNPRININRNLHLNLSTNEVLIDKINATESNIMKPSSDRVQKTISLISNRIRNLFVSTTSTPLVKPVPKGKGLLNIFEVIKFQNVPCFGSPRPLRQLNGTCYHKFECESFGGTVVGVCADGYGVCCVFKYGCGGITRQIVSYFESYKFPKPSNEPLACTLTVQLLRNVRQLRIDFLFLELKQPTRGNCVDDQFIVSGHSSNFKVPILCGINSGQHLYVDVQRSIEGRIFLSVFGLGTAERVFSIKITQLVSNFAPTGCLQYYTDVDGYISSFNYADVGSITKAVAPTYLNNLNYAICIKREDYSCNITYSNVVEDREYPFQILNVNYDGSPSVLAGQAGIDIFGCPDDFIVVNGERLCGSKFNDGTINEDLRYNALVTDNLGGPITVYVKTDESTVGRGFKLLYNQNPCLGNLNIQ